MTLRARIAAARLAAGLTPRQAAARSRQVRSAVASDTLRGALTAVRRLEPAYVAGLVEQGRKASAGGPP